MTDGKKKNNTIKLVKMIYINGFKGARKLPPSVVEMNCPFA